ncbi:hypothetical protein EVAR_72616_1 [Eumeta japonica]|uniref:Uncharacterized protein n=1 Tax=Eumeta variegata TaxID=151549 RepID=A0A4C2AE70_EUMVA|nr:hypothetical protein EVAR_72616_1 [Eumeta japonica]
MAGGLASFQGYGETRKCGFFTDVQSGPRGRLFRRGDLARRSQRPDATYTRSTLSQIDVFHRQTDRCQSGQFIIYERPSPSTSRKSFPFYHDPDLNCDCGLDIGLYPSGITRLRNVQKYSCARASIRWDCKFGAHRAGGYFEPPARIGFTAFPPPSPPGGALRLHLSGSPIDRCFDSQILNTLKYEIKF